MVRTLTGTGTPYRRMLDLLSGWATFAESSAMTASTREEKEAYDREYEAIVTLYTDLANKSGPYATLDALALVYAIKVQSLIEHGAASHMKGDTSG